jgi:hypothetical protein
MAGLIEESTNGSVSSQTAEAPFNNSPVEKPVFEVAASQAVL